MSSIHILNFFKYFGSFFFLQPVKPQFKTWLNMFYKVSITRTYSTNQKNVYIMKSQYSRAVFRGLENLNVFWKGTQRHDKISNI